MSSRLPTSRFRRCASSSTVEASSFRSSGMGGGSTSRPLAAPVIAASGVRRSWETELKSVLRRRSLSAAIRAASALAASRARSSGPASWRASAWISSRWSGASGALLGAEPDAEHAKRPRRR